MRNGMSPPPNPGMVLRDSRAFKEERRLLRAAGCYCRVSCWQQPLLLCYRYDCLMTRIVSLTRESFLYCNHSLDPSSLMQLIPLDTGLRI